MLSITPNRDIVIGCHFPDQQPPEWMDEAWPMPLSILIPGHNTNAALNIHYNASAQTPRVSQHRSDTRNRTEMICCTIALCKELHYCLRQIWSWYFYSDFWSLKASLFYFLPQKSIPIWLHSETLVSCPVNLVRNCCFIEAIFSLNNNQNFIASFMLGAGGVSCSIALLCPSCSFQLCSLVWGKSGREKHMYEPVFIIIYHLIRWSNMTFFPHFSPLCFIIII